jgi:hypothetical protein
MLSMSTTSEWDEDDEEAEYWLSLAEGVMKELDLDIVNGAMRTWDGTFGQLPNRIFPGDGRHPVDPNVYLDLARTIFVLVQVVVTGSVFDAMQSMADLRHAVEILEQQLVVYARSVGWAWRDVGDALGVTRSAAHERFAQVEVPFRRRGADPVTRRT